MDTPFGNFADIDNEDWFSGYEASKSLMSGIWFEMDHLRDYPIDQVGPHILFLLTLERYGYFQKVDGWKSIKALLESDEVKQLPHYSILHELYTNGKLLLRKETPEQFQRVVARIREERTAFSADQFPLFFDNLLYSMFSANSKAGGNHLLTGYLRGLMSSAAGIAEAERIFNPFAGLASFGMYLPKETSFFGQEINDQTFDFARLRAVAHDITLNDDFFLRKEDTFTNWPVDKKFDVVIANPPFGISLNRYSKEISSCRSAQNFLIRNGILLLKPKGKLVVLVSEAFLFRGGVEQKTRRDLIETDFIETVISLPQGMLNGTSVASAILVINRDKRSKGAVKFAAPNSVDMGKGVDQMFIGDIIEEISELDYASTGVGPVRTDMRLVLNSEIVDQDYSFQPDRYLLSDYTGVKLSELLTPLPGKLIRGKYSGRLTTIKHLVAEDQHDYTIEFPPLTENEMVSGEYILPKSTRKIESSALMVAVAGRLLKPSFFYKHRQSESEKFPVYLSPQVKAFNYDRERLELDFLIHQLRSPAVKTQLRAYQTGTTIPRISVKDFLRIRIQLPSKQEQILTMRALEQLNEKMEALREERDAIAKGAKLAGDKRFATLKHALGRPQQSILSAAETIKDYLEIMGEDGQKLNVEYANFFEQERTISDTLQGIVNDIDFISNMMDRGENGLRVESYPLEYPSVSAVLKSVKELSTSGLKFKLKINAAPDKDWGKLSVEMNLELFRVLLENLLTNADKHGFEEKSPGNLVQITLSIINYHLFIEVQNNGKPFPSNFGKEQYVQEFKTISTDVGQGIGGHQVDQIANYFGDPEWALITDANKIFPVTFIFRFPISETVATIDNDGKIHPHE